MNFSSALGKSDLIGAWSSGLCAVHCMATPFLFVAQSCHAEACCDDSPGWWSAIDYGFVGITLVAVFFSAKNTSKEWMKYALYGSWFILSALVFNEKMAWISLTEEWKYGAAAVMISLHLYNRKFCQCADDGCCTA